MPGGLIDVLESLIRPVKAPRALSELPLGRLLFGDVDGQLVADPPPVGPSYGLVDATEPQHRDPVPVFPGVGISEIGAENMVVSAKVAWSLISLDELITPLSHSRPPAVGDGAVGVPTLNGIVLANAAGDSDIGTEIDVKVTHQLTDDLEVGLGIGYVASGDAIEDTSGEDDALIVIAANAVLTF